MPNYDESTMYTMEVFKFMNKKMDIYINKLGFQGNQSQSYKYILIPLNYS